MTVANLPCYATATALLCGTWPYNTDPPRRCCDPGGRRPLQPARSGSSRAQRPRRTRRRGWPSTCSSPAAAVWSAAARPCWWCPQLPLPPPPPPPLLSPPSLESADFATTAAAAAAAATTAALLIPLESAKHPLKRGCTSPRNSKPGHPLIQNNQGWHLEFEFRVAHWARPAEQRGVGAQVPFFQRWVGWTAGCGSERRGSRH